MVSECKLKCIKISHRYDHLVCNITTENILKENKFKCVFEELSFNLEGNTLSLYYWFITYFCLKESS